MGLGALEKRSENFNINGIIEDYYVYAGENISAGSFIEFINGIAGQTTATSSDIQLNENVQTGYSVSAETLPNGNVFIAHSYGSSLTLYGVVVTIDGVNITAGTDTILSNYTNRGKKISTALLPNGNVFIAHGDGGQNYLYGLVVTINGTTITAGTDTLLDTSNTSSTGDVIDTTALSNGNVFVTHSFGNNRYLYSRVVTISGTTITTNSSYKLGSSYGAYSISNTMLPDGKIFVGHCGDSNKYLYGIVCTISGTTITAGTDTKLVSSNNSGYCVSTVSLMNGNVFIAHSGSNTSYYLYGMVCTISGTTVTKGTDTAIWTSHVNSGYVISSILLENGNVFIAGSYSGSDYLYLMSYVCAISDTTITKTENTSISTSVYAGYAISLALLSSDIVFVAHSHTKNSYYLYGRIMGVKDNVPTTQVTTSIYETQVRNVTSSNANGIAKTSGVGGNSTAHNETVQIYVPDV